MAPQASTAFPERVDLLVVGGGVNGAAVAADGAGRGLSVLLVEAGDLACATSSASSKLIHGGIRYLEHREFGLVGKALAEREVLLRAAPHIVRPMRFRLPHRPGLRPAWMIRIGLFLYDHLARRSTLPGSRGLRFGADSPLRPEFTRGFEYSDCQVDDSRLVVLNAMAAARHGATVLTRTRCLAARREGAHWRVRIAGSGGGEREIVARCLVNATGTRVQAFIEDELGETPPRRVRLVRGSHIVVRRMLPDDAAWILQNDDGRIVFAIPWEDRFTLIGTTEQEVTDAAAPEISAEERRYLLDVLARHFKAAPREGDIVGSFSGVRTLLDDESADPSAITRDYLLPVSGGAREAGLVHVYGGKITTCRRLAEAVMDRLGAVFPGLPPPWTAGAALPGGDFASPAALLAELRRDLPWLPEPLARRYVRTHGTHARAILDGAAALADLGQDFGGGLHEAELRWFREREWAQTAEDVLWRRTKLGLVLSAGEQAALTERLEG